MTRQKLLILIVAFILGVCVSVVFAEQPDVKVEQATRAVLEENFHAATSEDLKRLMATISVQAPDRNQFARESQAVFDRTDVYIRLDEFKLLGVNKGYAAARVVQTTLPKNEKDRKEGNVYYATRSALLPEAETVEYTQLFRFEGGQWKVYKINSYVRPVEQPVMQDCPNGKCGASMTISPNSAFR